MMFAREILMLFDEHCYRISSRKKKSQTHKNYAWKAEQSNQSLRLEICIMNEYETIETEAKVMYMRWTLNVNMN